MFNIAKTKQDYLLGILKGKNVFSFNEPGEKNMTMNTPIGVVPYPISYKGYTNGKLTDQGIARPGDDFTVNGDLIIEQKLNNLNDNNMIDIKKDKPTDSILWNTIFNKNKLKHGGYMHPEEIINNSITEYTKKKGGWILSKYQDGGKINKDVAPDPNGGNYESYVKPPVNQIPNANVIGFENNRDNEEEYEQSTEENPNYYEESEVEENPQDNRNNQRIPSPEELDYIEENGRVNPFKKAKQEGKTMEEYENDRIKKELKNMGAGRNSQNANTYDLDEDYINNTKPIEHDEETGLDVLKREKKETTIPFEGEETVIDQRGNVIKKGGIKDTKQIGPENIENQLKSNDSGKVLTPHKALQEMGYWSENGWTPDAIKALKSKGLTESEINQIDYNDIAANLEPKDDGLDDAREIAGKFLRDKIGQERYGDTNMKNKESGDTQGDYSRFTKNVLEKGYPSNMPETARDEFDAIKNRVSALGGDEQAYAKVMTSLGTEEQFKKNYPNAFRYYTNQFDNTRGTEIKRNQYATLDVNETKGGLNEERGIADLTQVDGKRLDFSTAFGLAKRMGYDSFYHNGKQYHTKTSSEKGRKEYKEGTQFKTIPNKTISQYNNEDKFNFIQPATGRGGDVSVETPGSRTRTLKSQPNEGAGNVKNYTVKTVSKKEEGGYMPNQVIKYQHGGVIKTGKIKHIDPVTGDIHLY